MVSEHSILGQMKTNFNRELEERWGSIINRFQKLVRQWEEGCRDDNSGLDAQGRLVFSIFYGDNTEWWTSRAEKIFCLYQLSKAEKMEAATAYFGGEA